MKIFVSSTWIDLEEHRRKVREAIDGLRHQGHDIQWLGMESFGPKDNPPLDGCLKFVEEAELYLGMFGVRYGSRDPATGISMTECEYRHAVKHKKHRLLLLIDEQKAAVPPAHYEKDPDGITLLQKLKKDIMADRMIGFFTTPDNLASQVVVALQPFLKAGVGPVLNALHSLPSPPADFIGRMSQVEELVKQLSAGKGATISGLTGMAGVGKTALALVVAHKVADRYSDAQIYLDLRGASPTPLTSAEAMKHVILAFEPQADLRQVADTELAALYQSILHNKRALLLMDNAADAAQIKPLIPPLTCALLVTSRRNFALPGLQPVRIDVLPEQEAREFLLRLCSRIGDHGDTVAGLCGRLPIALRIAGSTLKQHIDLSLDEYVARLSDRQRRLKLLKSEDDPEANVEATFALSYELLKPEVQARWRALAVFPAPFDRPAASAVWESDKEETSRLLSDLLLSSLIEYNEETQRYRLHDLLADFANARLSDEERTSAQLRHAQHYVRIAGLADELYLQGGKNVLIGLALFDAELPHIQAGQAWAATSMKASKEATILCNAYPSAAIECLSLRLNRRGMIEWLKPALNAAYNLNNKRSQACHLGSLGNIYTDLGKQKEAIEYLKQALAISREINDRQYESASLNNLGDAYAALGKLNEAIDYRKQSLKIVRELSDWRGEAIILNNLGNSYFGLGKSEKKRAIKYFTKAWDIAQKNNAWPIAGTILGNLGNIYSISKGTRDLKKAIKYYEQALVVAQRISNLQIVGNNLYNLGQAYEKLGETQKAIKYTSLALRIFEKIESSYAGQARQQLEILLKAQKAPAQKTKRKRTAQDKSKQSKKRKTSARKKL